jgi:ADP-ribose pyrophosphatase YjhB (NUDIX family)
MMTHDPDIRPPSEPLTDSGAGSVPGGWLEHVLQVSAECRRARYEEARRAGARWLVECFDTWEFPRGEEGVDFYFETCESDSEVDAPVTRFADGWDRVAGIYDVSRPLDEQRGGLSPDAWRARRGLRA